MGHDQVSGKHPSDFIHMLDLKPESAQGLQSCRCFDHNPAKATVEMFTLICILLSQTHQFQGLNFHLLFIMSHQLPWAILPK